MMSAIGDAVHVLPVVSALKRSWPESRVTWVIQPVPHLLASGHPDVDEFILFHRRRGRSTWQSYREIQEQLSGRRFDLLLALQVYFKAGIIDAMAPSAVKLGFDWRRSYDLNWWMCSHHVPAHPDQHVQDQYFEFLRYLGVDPEPVDWKIRLSEEESLAQRQFFDNQSRPLCGVVVSASSEKRNWTPEGYARLLEAIESDYGYQPAILGGPSRREREMADRILSLTNARPLDLLADDLRRLIWLLKGCAFVVSPDTGPLHIARAVDTPVVGLYGYTNPKRAGPYRKYQDLVVDGYAEYPGETYTPARIYRDGMERVTLDMVLDKVEICVSRYVRGEA
jgi:heptosyltransferase I